VGSCAVKVPYGHRLGSIGSSLLKRILVIRADDRICVESISVLNTDRFLQELGAGLSVDKKRRALLYVHGYNTTFEGAAIRAAQIGLILEFAESWHFTVGHPIGRFATISQTARR